MGRIRRFLAVVAAVIMCLGFSNARSQDLSFNLPDLDGNPVKLARQDQEQFTVVCFLGTECPLAKLYASRINRFADDLHNVQFIGVCSNQQDSLEDLRGFREKHQIKFPLLKDRNQIIADQFGAQRTPEVFLVDRSLKILYHGRIDDQYQPGIAKSEPTRQDLAIAIDESLAGKSVTVSVTEPEGCLIGRVKIGTDAGGDITYAHQISRILQNHCSECHRAGEIGPMELAQYDEVVGWAEMIVEVVDNERMPPWHADPNCGEFVNERRISSAEKQMLRQWLAAGTPKGNLADLPPKREFADSSQWRLPTKPDLVIPMRAEPFVVPAQGVVEYQYFVVDPGLTEDKWVTAAEILPGDRSVLHHSIVFVRPPDGTEMRGIGWLAAYVPGQSAPTFNPKFGRRIPAGSRFVFQQHYTPNGKQATDVTKIGLVFGNEQEIQNEVFTLLALNQEFVIPPGAGNHSVSAKFPWLPRQGTLLGIAPHMHYRGKSFEVTAIREKAGKSTQTSELSSEILLRVPNYDFNWQPIYQFRDPIPLANVQSIEFVATFDNSIDNRANPDPTQRVFWGDQTFEEMAVAFAIIAQPRDLKEIPSPDLTSDQELALEKHQRFVHQKINGFVDDYFRRFDANADGQISPSELPRSIRDYGLWQIDINEDRVVTRAEVMRAAESHFENKYPFDPAVH